MAAQYTLDESEDVVDSASSFKVTSISETILLVDDNVEILTYLQKKLSRNLKLLQPRMDVKHWRY